MTRRLRWIGLIVVAAGILVVIWSQSGSDERKPEPARHVRPNVPGPRGPAADPTHQGGLSGQVVDPDGQGVAGALVTLQTRPPFRATVPRTFKTGPGGAFHFDGLAPGLYLAQASAQGFTAGFRNRLEVESDSILDEVRIQLWAGGLTLSGQVLDAGGGVIPGARVRATSYALNADDTHEARAFHTTADGDGRYLLQLPKGRHAMLAVADGYAPVTESLQVLGEQTKDFTLQPAARISGWVVSSQERAPVSGAQVSARREGRRDSAGEPSITDERGGFVIESLSPGSYAVTARTPGMLGALDQPIVLGATDAVDGVEVVVSATFAVRGRATSVAGKPVANARIKILSLDRPPLSFGPPPGGLTDSDGRYAVDGVLAGKHLFEISAQGYASQSEPISISADATRDVVLQDQAVVSGLVLKTNGQPASRALVGAPRGHRRRSGAFPPGI